MQSIGKLVHFSIPTHNFSVAEEFYGKLFGWKFKRMTDTYWLTEDGLGSLSLESELVSGTTPILYFSVARIDDSLKQVIEFGGKIILQKTDSGDGKSP